MTSAPRWRRRKEARPSEIVDAALAAFVERGFAATRLDDVARRAGIGKGTLYLYFPSKEELFKAVVRQHLLPNVAAAERRLAEAAGPTGPLLTAIVGTLIGAAAGPMGAIPKLVIGEAANFPDLARFYADEVVARGFGVLRALVARGVERGEFRPVDPATVAPLLAAPILLTALWKNALEPHATHRMDADALAAAASDLLLRGLEARPGEGT